MKNKKSVVSTSRTARAGIAHAPSCHNRNIPIHQLMPQASHPDSAIKTASAPAMKAAIKPSIKTTIKPAIKPVSYAGLARAAWAGCMHTHCNVFGGGYPGDHRRQHYCTWLRALNPFTTRTDDLYDLFPVHDLDLPGMAHLFPTLSDLPYVVGWEPHNLHDQAHVSGLDLY